MGNDDYSEVDVCVIPTIEKYIRSNDKFLKQFSTNNRLEDFKEEDIVRCTFAKGLYKVKSLNQEKSKLSLYSIDLSEDFYEISPEFVEKLDLDDKMVKVLYGS